MDFVEINFEAIRHSRPGGLASPKGTLERPSGQATREYPRAGPHIYLISPNQSIEDYKNVYKSVFESFDKFCLSKKNI